MADKIPLQATVSNETLVKHLLDRANLFINLNSETVQNTETSKIIKVACFLHKKGNNARSTMWIIIIYFGPALF